MAERSRGAPTRLHEVDRKIPAPSIVRPGLIERPPFDPSHTRGVRDYLNRLRRAGVVLVMNYAKTCALVAARTKRRRDETFARLLRDEAHIRLEIERADTWLDCCTQPSPELLRQQD